MIHAYKQHYMLTTDYTKIKEAYSNLQIYDNMMSLIPKVISNKFIFLSCKKLLGQYMYSKNVYLKYRFCSSYQNIDKIKIQNLFKNIENEYKTLQLNESSNDKRLKQLSPILNGLKERSAIFEHLSSLKALVNENDEEMKKLAEEEKGLYEKKLSDLEEQILECIISSDETDSCNAIVLEINAGVGGQEAMLFAREMIEMYFNFVNFKGWDYEIAEFDTSDMGGLRHASILVKGEDVFRYFKYEAGVHRVQRIPSTEKSGRMHTSTVSVVALPQPKDVDVIIQEKDLKIETKRSSGAGGQHVNTTDSAVRIVHLPTGISVECQVDRSQIKNKEMAMQRLKAKLYEQQINQQIADIEATRKSQVRSNFRNEKIRTYNFAQDRITDHRLQSSNFHNLKGFLTGGEQLELLINKLNSAARREKLMNILDSK